MMNDRMEQIRWLKYQADIILHYDTTESTAEELVTYWEQNIEDPKRLRNLPTWFDDHDRELIVEYVWREVRR